MPGRGPQSPWLSLVADLPCSRLSVWFAVSKDSLPTEYENGIADVLAFSAGSSAVVHRNVKLPGHSSGSMRQVDIQVTGRIFGVSDATLIVDCKRWGKPVDVADAGAFLDLVEDVRADFGLLVTTAGASAAARQRLRSARGTRHLLMTLQELAAWRPAGTLSTNYRIPKERKTDAEKSLRRAGFRVMVGQDPRITDNEVCLTTFRHYGIASPPPEVAQEADFAAASALGAIGITDAVILGHGIVTGGGTPAHRWVDVAVHGIPIGQKILVASESDVAEQLSCLRETQRQYRILPAEAFDVIRPDGWPVQHILSPWV